MKSHQLRKWATGLVLVGVFMFSGAVLFQMQVAFGWNNPTANPPGGAGMMAAGTNQAMIGLPPVASTTGATIPVLTINGGLSMLNNLISDLNAPIGDKDAVNKGYVLAQTGGVTVGSGSVVLYYKTINGVPQGAIPTCPTGWTYQQTNWYGPHYIGVVSYDYYYNGSGGSGGGFGGTAPYDPPPPGPGLTSTAGPPPDPPPPPGSGTAGITLANGYSYNANTIAFGSDSVCSQQQKTVVPMNQFYMNAFTATGATWYSDACSTTSNPNAPPPTITECNMCVICAKP